ncbi:MAG: hypothetical protein IJK23_10220 [Clostridia bacterium]|nr:hypothetical protein [Clostridia bacterium]
MNEYGTSLRLTDNITPVLDRIMSAFDRTLDAYSEFSAAIGTDKGAAAIDAAAQAVAAAHEAVNGLNEALDQTAEKTQNAPAGNSFAWQSEPVEVFTNSGIDRFREEAQSALDLIGRLAAGQAQITAAARAGNLLPPQAIADLQTADARVQALRQRIAQIAGKPLNLVDARDNAELEQLRGQLAQALEIQRDLNRAVDTMDVEGANTAYRRLVSTIGGAERQIRDSTNEQGRLNEAIEDGGRAAAGLSGQLGGVLRAYAGIAGLRKLFDFGKSAFEAYSDQLNSSVQLKSVLANMLDADYIASFQVEADTRNAQEKLAALENSLPSCSIPVTADIGDAREMISGLGNSAPSVTVPVTANTLAVNAAFDKIRQKAADLQDQGIFGDETMIAAGAEFATYFSDTEAITALMDTLSNYAIGMEGVTEVSQEKMTDLATGLGKIMTGSYEAMTKKGFEFTDVQKAIIEGSATNAQIASQLGEEYVNMSQDMQAVAAITQVINEAWGGLYENMSNTPAGKLLQLQHILGDMKETIGEGVAPYITEIVNVILAHKDEIQKIVQNITEHLQHMLTVAAVVIEFAMNIVDNWDKIRPVVLGIAGAVGVLAVALGIATIAQNIMNSAMLASPVTWIILAVVALIALIFVAVKRILSAAGIVDDSIGGIVGVIFAAGAAIVNTVIGVINGVIQFLWGSFVEPFIGIIEWVLNVCNGGFDSFGDAVMNLLGNIVSGFLSLGKVVTQIIDAIFGTNWTAGLSELQNKVLAWGKNENAITISREAPTINYRMDYGDAYQSGVNFGNKLEQTLENFDDGMNIPAGTDYSGVLGSIDGTTAEISDSVSSRGEDELEYLRMIAEREVVNKYTTAQINLDMRSEATIHSDTDIDGFFNKMTEELRDQLLITAERLQA